MNAAALFAEFAVAGGQILAELAAGSITERQASERMLNAMDALRQKRMSVDAALAEINAKWLAKAAALPPGNDAPPTPTTLSAQPAGV